MKCISLALSNYKLTEYSKKKMYSDDEVPRLVPYCLWCFGQDKLSRCSRCNNAYYCCREHQVQHWKIHRKDCKPPEKTVKNVQTTVASCTDTVPSTVDSILQMPLDHIVSQLTQNIQQQPQQSTYSNWTCNSIDQSAVVSVTNASQVPTYPYMYSVNDSVLSPQPAPLYQASDDQAAPLYEASDVANIDNIYAATAASGLVDKLFIGSNENVFSSLSSELLSSTNNYWDIINNCSAENIPLNYDLDILNSKPVEDERIIQSQPEDLNFIPEPSLPEVENNDHQQISNNDNLNDNNDDNLALEQICLNVVHDLNEFGICVIDQFLETKIGDHIASEVKSLYLKGIFQKGELVSSGIWNSSQDIRGDVITWVDGTELGCFYIASLIKKLDFVLAACNNMPDNGILSKYKLNRRTKAMIACYPGDGTHYKKHIDNPHGDGRCITCIYYLNKQWDTKKHGGLLRMFPVGHENEVANIEPIFDRMLFFWSDKRNPHEVLPSYATRFAITVWYFDADERSKALQKCRVQI